MTDCELLHTCPYFNDMTKSANELAVLYKESYCHGSYNWCGRYMAFKALEREMNIAKSAVALVSAGAKMRNRGSHRGNASSSGSNLRGKSGVG